MALPTLTAEQRADALAKAAASRAAASAAKAELAAGTLDISTVLAGKEPRLLRAPVLRVLCAVPGVGEVTAKRLLAEAGVDLKRRVQGLGPHQRAALTGLVAA